MRGAAASVSTMQTTSDAPASSSVKNQRKHVTEAMQVVTIHSAHAFTRRTNEIKETYRKHNAASETFCEIVLATVEKGKKDNKRHRDCGRSSALFIAEVMNHQSRLSQGVVS